jgi:hypothetical protein
VATPAEELGRSQGLVQPLRLTEGITRSELAATLRAAAQEAGERLLFALANGRLTEAAQLRSAIDSLGSLSQSMWGQIGSQTRAGIYNASELAASHQLDRDYLVGMPFNAIGQYADDMYFSAFQSAEDIISRRTNGFALQERIYRNGQATTAQVGKIVEQGLALQQSAKQIAQAVRAHYRPDVPGGASYAAMRLGRTEINNAHHDTTIRLSQDLPWVLGYRWNLSGSHLRPDICNVYADGNSDDGTWTKAKVPSKPHPQCLCYLTVEMEEPDDFQRKLTKGDYDDSLDSLGVTC